MGVLIHLYTRPTGEASVFIRIDPSSGVPIYRQILDQVKVAVATGTLRAKDQLPSVRALSEILSINPTTVQRAYLDLERERVIETRRGQGTFVRSQSISLPVRERARRFADRIRQALAEAHRLQLADEEVKRVLEEELVRFRRSLAIAKGPRRPGAEEAR
jgi:GntR family transcriptional regulator